MAGVDYDVGIVGGGISGLLFAHRLLKAQPQARVVLWEALDAMGGRVIVSFTNLTLLTF
jgi:protoporphyrinogen oxidase